MDLRADLPSDVGFPLSNDDSEGLSTPLAARFSERTTGAWVSSLTKAGVAAVRVAIDNRAEFFCDPAHRASGRVAEYADERFGRIREVSRLLRVTPARQLPHGLAPRKGEHTVVVLRELGFADPDITALTAAGVVAGPETAVT
jgi:crotonobetainyl-CoA:carnitine CoA-transferase CaiB-like acyl-CoA transferase